MNNIIIGLQRFLKNKNTVTIIGVILILAALYFGYNMQIKKQVDPISVPVAKQEIPARTKITSDMITYVKMPRMGVNSSAVYQITNLVVGKYTNYDTVIPEGSMFYKRSLISAEELPDSYFTQVKEDYVAYNFAVNTATTYGNSIFPGNKIDLYMKAEDDTGQVMVAKLIENIEVLAVKDSTGKNVFENANDSRTPAYMIFGVPADINILLRKAEYMKNYGVVVFPVPHGGTVADKGETTVSSTYLKEFINSKTVDIPIEDNNVTPPVKPEGE